MPLLNLKFPAGFVSDLFENHIVGFLISQLTAINIFKHCSDTGKRFAVSLY